MRVSKSRFSRRVSRFLGPLAGTPRKVSFFRRPTFLVRFLQLPRRVGQRHRKQGGRGGGWAGERISAISARDEKRERRRRNGSSRRGHRSIQLSLSPAFPRRFSRAMFSLSPSSPSPAPMSARSSAGILVRASLVAGRVTACRNNALIPQEPAPRARERRKARD